MNFLPNNESNFYSIFKAFDGVTVEYITVPGWKTSITECKTFDSLPSNAKDYINMIEDFLHIPGMYR